MASFSFESAAAKGKILLRDAAAGIIYNTPLLSRFRKASPHPWKILTYHRVTKKEGAGYPLQSGMWVTPETFSDQMRFLRAKCNPVSLSTLIKAIDGKEQIPANTVVVTFDDGWKDNYDFAFPVLKREQIPATICLATAFIGTKNTFWTDRLMNALSLLRQSTHREAAGKRIQNLDCALAAKAPLYAFLEAGENTDLSALTETLLETLKQLPRKERDPLLAEILRLAKEFADISLERSFLNWEEIKEMRRSGIHFISHSHHHFTMTELEEAQLRDEVLDSFQSFRESGMEPDKLFCYPGGAYNALCQRVASECGVTHALTMNRESNFTSQPKLLGRINIHQDVSKTPARFAARLWVPRF